MDVRKKLNTAKTYVVNNGVRSFARYCSCRYITKTDSMGLTWGLSSARRSVPLIASLTSYPARIETVDVAIKSILCQTMKPDRLILWLAEEQFPGRETDLPAQLLALRDFGLEIRWCDDLLSHKKYYYAMQFFPQAAIMTFDDDLIYYPDTIEDLYRMHVRFPERVIATRAHRMRFDAGGALVPYETWEMCVSEPLGEPQRGLFSTSGAGTLYPPRCMHPLLFDRTTLLETCAHADDVWLKCMQVMKGTNVVLARPDRPLQYIDGTQEVGLAQDNLLQGGNDVQLRAVFKAFAAWRSRDGKTLEELFASN